MGQEFVTCCNRRYGATAQRHHHRRTRTSGTVARPEAALGCPSRAAARGGNGGLRTGACHRRARNLLLAVAAPDHCIDCRLLPVGPRLVALVDLDSLLARW